VLCNLFKHSCQDSLPFSQKRRRIPPPGVRRRGGAPSQSFSRNKKRGDRYEKEFVSDSSESEDTSYSESSSSSESSDEDLRARERVVVKKSPVIVQTKCYTVTKVPIKKKKTSKDRFYDKSRDIPNDVYFGDVNGEPPFDSSFSIAQH